MRFGFVFSVSNPNGQCPRETTSALISWRKKGEWPNKALWTVSQGVTETSYLKYSSLRQRLPLAASSSSWAKSSQFLQSKKNVETWEPFPVPPLFQTRHHHQLPVLKSQKRRQKLLDKIGSDKPWPFDLKKMHVAISKFPAGEADKTVLFSRSSWWL